MKLYCNTEDNEEMDEVCEEFNKIREGMCELKLQISEEEFEGKIIEIF